MIRKIFLLTASCMILLWCEVVSAFSWGNLHPSVILGSGYTTLGGTQNVRLANTPEPGLVNAYSGRGNQRDTNLFGIALENTCSTTLKNVESAVGFEVDFLRNRSMGGVVHPMVNLAPDFDTLNYSFKMHSYLMFLTGKLSKLDILPNLGGYIQAGVGGAFNKFFDYSEITPAGSSASPMLSPFANGSNSQFAYSFGVGIVCQLGKSTRALIGYRYINSGLGGFDPSPIQQTNNTLDFSSLGHHFLTISIVV